MRNPVQSHAEAEKKIKRYVKNETSAEAPSRCRSSFPRRPLLPAAAGRTPRGRRLLPNAVESDLSTGGVALAARCEHRRSLSSPRPRSELRTSTAAPFATRNATTAGWPPEAAQCSADASYSPKTRSRLPRSRRRWPRTAGRSPSRAASAMWLSRRAEE